MQYMRSGSVQASGLYCDEKAPDWATSHESQANKQPAAGERPGSQRPSHQAASSLAHMGVLQSQADSPSSTIR